LEALHPDFIFLIEVIKTSGDKLKDAPLTVIGGQGVFIKELEDALLDGRIDIAVHSLKDLPTTIPEDLQLAAITERGDARDALVLRADYKMGEPSISTLAPKAVVGTSSPRRLAQLKYLCPERLVKDLRGNVDTRLRKLDGGWYEALILASAGLTRLGLTERISAFVDPTEMLPAVGQGALGIEIRLEDEDTFTVVSELNHPPTSAACKAERALLRALGGGCQLPIAGYATLLDQHLRLDGLVAEPNGTSQIRDTIEGLEKDAEALGKTLASRLLAQGAADLIHAVTSKMQVE
jgi:hydroxymethylbilane synthase